MPSSASSAAKSCSRETRRCAPGLEGNHSTIQLCQNLGRTVVAEGVEDPATLARLRDLGCDFAQGFHIARPMDAVALREWLRSRQ